MITGELSIIRGVQEEDLKLFNKWRNDPEFSRLSNGFVYQPETLEETRNWLEADKSDPTVEIFTITTTEGQAIGYATLYKIDYRNRTCHFGTAIGEPLDRGKGVGSDVRRALLKYLFAEWNFHHVYGSFPSYNIASRRSHEKLGARILGEMKRMLFVKGEYQGLFNYVYDRVAFLAREKELASHE